MKPSTFRQVRKYGSGLVDAGLIETAARRRKLKVLENEAPVFRLRAGLSLWSIGETIDVVLGAIDGCTLVDITSKCVVPMQIADWGKNERNVRRFFKEIDGILGAPDFVRCRLCGKCDYLLVGIPGEPCPECGEAVSADQEPVQETATVRNVLVLILGLTLVEIAAGILLKLVGLGHFAFWMMKGPFVLLFFNAFIALQLIVVHRMVRRWLARR